MKIPLRNEKSLKNRVHFCVKKSNILNNTKLKNIKYYIYTGVLVRCIVS